MWVVYKAARVHVREKLSAMAITPIKAETTHDRCTLDEAVPQLLELLLLANLVGVPEDDVVVAVGDVDWTMSLGRTPDAVVTGEEAFCEFWYTVPFPMS
jgi:hypothetical protein